MKKVVYDRLKNRKKKLVKIFKNWSLLHFSQQICQNGGQKLFLYSSEIFLIYETKQCMFAKVPLGHKSHEIQQKKKNI